MNNPPLTAPERPFSWHCTGNVDYAPAKHGLPVKEESLTQIGVGELLTDALLISANETTLFRCQLNLRTIGVTVVNPDYVTFAIPIYWRGELFINGEPARSSRVYLPSDALYFHGGGRETLGAVLPRKKFIETLAALGGIGPEDVKLAHPVLDFPPAVLENVRSRLNTILDSKPGILEPHAFSNDVFGLLADLYLFAQPESTGKFRRRRRPPEQIVRKAEERFMAAQGAPVSLADLCAAAGVSKSTLYHTFQCTCDLPPLEYFRRRRLMQARSMLFDSAPERGAVKRTALTVGFTELGRFSVEYRRLFGESPSITLTKPPY